MEHSEFVSNEFPQLSDISYFDYKAAALVSKSQQDLLKTLSNELLPSPHSSEDQSEFDRTLSLLRKNIASLFSTSLINYTVILFQTPREALNTIFEGFPWSHGSKYFIDNSFCIDHSDAVKFANKNGAVQQTSLNNESNTSQSLYCMNYTHEDLEKFLSLMKRSGRNHVLLDSTKTAPYEFVDLSVNNFDFVLLSMKQICGIELCACLIRLDTAEQISPMFYGGGAVAFSCARSFAHRSFKSHTKRLENGTPSLFAIFESYEGLKLMNKMKNSFDVNEIVNSNMELFKHVLDKYESIKYFENILSEVFDNNNK